MKILNIHGYHGSPANAAAGAAAGAGFVVESPAIDYDKWDPLQILWDLDDLFTQTKCEGVIGTSLGGFFALMLSAKRSIPALLINPAVCPGMILPKLGYTRAAGVRGFWHIDHMYLDRMDWRYFSTIVGTDDDMFSDDMKEYTKAILKNSRFYEVEGGKHEGSTLGLPELFKKHKEEWFYDIITKPLA